MTAGTPLRHDSLIARKAEPRRHCSCDATKLCRSASLLDSQSVCCSLFKDVPTLTVCTTHSSPTFSSSLCRRTAPPAARGVHHSSVDGVCKVRYGVLRLSDSRKLQETAIPRHIFPRLCGLPLLWKIISATLSVLQHIFQRV